MSQATRVLALLISLAFVGQSLIAQPQKKPPVAAPQKPAKVEQVEEAPAEQDLETLKVDTNLVTVPVIASSRTGRYIADLVKEEFKISEDGVAQEIAFLATVSAPFTLVLLLDTSGSTKEKLPTIQRAAMAFVEQLSSTDKVKVISFDDSVRDWNEFTSDKAVIRKAISQTVPGEGSKVYDAVELSLNNLRPVSGRRAIVVFTDGVDWHSDRGGSYEGTLKNLDESGVIIYPIRFDTRAETEAIARRQAGEQTGIGLPTSDVIRQGTTPSTFPSEDPASDPNRRGQGKSPLEMILSRPVRRPIPTETPQGSPTDFPDAAGGRRPPIDPGPAPNRRPSPDDSIKGMLDQAYFLADSYLKELADRSGGQVHRADTLAMLPQAFAAIAAELRTQYSLGYYPTNREKNGKYRKIQVKTTRTDVAIRARPGYRR
ncbi:MAG TPA: VWA domain-containing protein [Pyrinomonadaceae bacterium]